MNYQKIHDAIITRARDRILTGYKEKHHVIPLSLGGEDRNYNKVSLTASEHYIIHLLLAKIHGGVMVSAFKKMRHLTSNPPNNKEFAARRELLCTTAGEKAKDPQKRKNHSLKMKGRNHTESTKLSISNSMTGENNPMKGIPAWRNPTNISRGTHKNWLAAGEIYDLYITGKFLRVIDLFNACKLPTSYGTVSTIKTKLELGWKPRKDADWLQFYEEHK
jgi:hypothetical protein